jgi:hypothetical protein
MASAAICHARHGDMATQQSPLTAACQVPAADTCLQQLQLVAVMHAACRMSMMMHQLQRNCNF